MPIVAVAARCKVPDAGARRIAQGLRGEFASNHRYLGDGWVPAEVDSQVLETEFSDASPLLSAESPVAVAVARRRRR